MPLRQEQRGCVPMPLGEYSASPDSLTGFKKDCSRRGGRARWREREEVKGANRRGRSNRERGTGRKRRGRRGKG